MSAGLAALLLLVGMILGGLLERPARAGLLAVGRWLARCADNLAMRLSPCALCEGTGQPAQDPTRVCTCAAGRRAMDRHARAREAYMARNREARRG